MGESGLEKEKIDISDYAWSYHAWRWKSHDESATYNPQCADYYYAFCSGLVTKVSGQSFAFFKQPE